MLSILEYSDIGSTQRGSLAFPLEPPLAIQGIEIGLTSVQSKPLAATTAIVRLSCTVDCAIAIGPDPDASGSVRFLAAGKEQIITVPPGSGLKIAAVATGSGSMSDSLGAFLKVIADPAAAQKTMDGLTKQAADIDAAAKGLRDATAEASRGRTLADWEADLKQREDAVAAGAAALQAKTDALRALTA